MFDREDVLLHNTLIYVFKEKALKPRVPVTLLITGKNVFK